MSLERMSDLVLRLGLAFAFLYPPIDAIFHPYSWLGYFPKFFFGYISDLALLHTFGIVEVALAIWILSGVRILLPSLIAAIMLILIVLFNMPNIEVVFRDVAIACMALSLAIARWRRTPQF